MRAVDVRRPVFGGHGHQQKMEEGTDHRSWPFVLCHRVESSRVTQQPTVHTSCKKNPVAGATLEWTCCWNSGFSTTCHSQRQSSSQLFPRRVEWQYCTQTAMKDSTDSTAAINRNHITTPSKSTLGRCQITAYTNKRHCQSMIHSWTRDCSHPRDGNDESEDSLGVAIALFIDTFAAGDNWCAASSVTNPLQ